MYRDGVAGPPLKNRVAVSLQIPWLKKSGVISFNVRKLAYFAKVPFTYHDFGYERTAVWVMFPCPSRSLALVIWNGRKK